MLDLDELAVGIQNMTRRQELYQVLKRELTARGYWKPLPRGNPKKGYAGLERKLRQLARGK